VLSIVATDQDIANHNVGTYEYKVIIEMVDLTTSAINYTIERLTKFLTEYNKFLSASDSMGAKRFDMSARLKRNKKELLSLNQQWKGLINSFMTSVEFIFGRSAFPEFSSLEWRKNMITMANPANGDIKSMRMLSEIIKNFISNLMRASRGPTSAASAGSSKAISKIQSSNKSKKKIVLEHVFSSNYTRDASAGEGTDYLDDTKTSNDPLNYTSINFDDLVSRIDAELEKFKVPRPNAPGVNKFGFMSPKRLSTNGSIVETAAVDLPQELGNGILNSSLKSTRHRGPVPSNDSEKIYDAEVDGILGFADVQIVSNTIPLNKIAETPNFGKEKKKSFALRSSNYLGLKDAFNKDTSDHKTALSGSQEQKFKSKRSPKQQIKKAPIVNHMSQMAAVGFKPPPKYMPNPQSTSLASAAAKQKPSTLDDNSTFGRSVNFNSLAEIQYFDGYSTSNGMINLNAPIWRTLTQNEFESMLDSDAKVLCRTLLLNRAMMMPNKYKLPEYDNLFVLGNKTAGPALLNYGQSDYKDIFKSMWRKFKTDMKLDSLNIEDYAGDVDTSYAQVPLETALGARVKRGAVIGESKKEGGPPRARKVRRRSRGKGGSY